MDGSKTVVFIALLNLFSLKNVCGDEFYDSLKAKGKFDPETTKEVRQNTIEKKRMGEMNALTQSNPDYVPLAPGPGPVPVSESERRRQKAAEANEPAEPDESPVPGYVGAKNEDMSAPSAKSPDIKIPYAKSGPATPVEHHLKVTTDDPDEVVFPGEEKPKTSPVPVRRK